MRSVSWLQGILIAIGCGCLLTAGINQVNAASFQQLAGQTLDRQLMASASPAGAPAGDGSLIGRLEIPRLQVSVIVIDGDDDASLARAVGRVRGTAFPWESGNAVMAGHRDTFFRPLRNLRVGDAIRMTTARGTFDYRVTRTQIVDPEDVSVLEPTTFRALTLVTCYPFVYVGRAPKRFIVHATQSE